MHSVILHYQLLYRRWLPIIPVVLNWRGVSVRSEGYLDSGAFYSIFKMSSKRCQACLFDVMDQIGQRAKRVILRSPLL